MISQLKYFFVKALGIPSFVNWLNRNRLLVLAYHSIYEGHRSNQDLLPNTFVHVDDLAGQLRYIIRKYQVIEPDDLVAFFETGSPLPNNAALITFDDGYESFYRLAEPVLSSMGIRALVFIPTRYIEQHEPFWFDLAWLFLKLSPHDKLDWLMKDLELKSDNLKPSVDPTLFLEKMKKMPLEQRNETVANITGLMEAEVGNWASIIKSFYPMTGNQIKKLSELGTTFGGHTHTHTILSAMPDPLAENEVLVNKKKLELFLDKPCNFFAYPNGREEDFTEKHKEFLRLAGYQAAFSLTQRRSFIYKDSMDISRINVAPEDTLSSLSFRCSGVVPAVNRLKGISF